METFKILVVGDINSGKTTYIHRLSGQDISNISETFISEKTDVHLFGRSIQFIEHVGDLEALWDTPDACIIMLDLTKNEDYLEYYTKRVQKSWNIPIAICCNKLDIYTGDIVGERFYISAKYGTNLYTPLKWILEQVKIAISV